MAGFIKKIFEDKIDEQVHSQFVRFGKGSYGGKALISLQKTSKVKLKGSFEYANDFVNLVAELGNFNFSGIILSKEKLDLDNEKKKSNILRYEVNIDSEKVREIKNKVYCMLLNTDSEDLKLKIKKKLPKPGKSENKVDDKFCQLECDFKYWQKIKDFFGLPEARKVKINHTFIINEVIYPEGEKDPVKMRLNAKKKGKIIRKLEIDKREEVREKEFLV